MVFLIADATLMDESSADIIEVLSNRCVKTAELFCESVNVFKTCRSGVE